LVAAIGENQTFRVAKWHNPEIRQAKEMCFDGTEQNRIQTAKPREG
jgi:hypothetical protein